VAGAAQSPLVCIGDAVKCTRQVDDARGAFRRGAVLEVLNSRVQQLGWRHGLFRGLGLTTVRESPSYGVYFVIYEKCKVSLSQHLPTTAAVLTSGGLAGVGALGMFHPVDVVKSRLQTTTEVGVTGREILRRGLRDEGISFLGRGFSAMVIRTFVLNAATFYGYEVAKGMLSGL